MRNEYELLRLVDEGVAGATGAEFFRTLTEALACALDADNAFVTEFSADRQVADVLAEWKDGALLAMPTPFALRGSPCELTLGGEIVAIEQGVCTRYPYLAETRAQSYLAIPLLNRDHDVLGHLAVFDDEPRQWRDVDRGVLRIFAARAAAEVERRRFEQVLEAQVAARTAELAASHAELTALKNRLQHENRYLRQELGEHVSPHGFVGTSAAIRDVLMQVARVAPMPTTVLVIGESGTGKELIARAIHEQSPRAERAMIKLNCAAIASSLVESELFGHVKGAFTGASERRDGRFALAHGGTLFLDEIGELPLEAQAKLLRVLQEREFEPVGSAHTMRVDVRVIAATNRDLRTEVAAGRFRADLYHRLNVFPIAIPPLRARRGDIVPLARHFLTHYARSLGRRFADLDAQAIARLEAWRWPGNVRELSNVIERAAILAQEDRLDFDHLFDDTVASSTQADEAAQRGEHGGDTMADMQRRHLITVLRRTRGVIEGDCGAARLLNMKPSTARYRMRKLGITRADYEG